MWHYLKYTLAGLILYLGSWALTVWLILTKVG